MTVSQDIARLLRQQTDRIALPITSRHEYAVYLVGFCEGARIRYEDEVPLDVVVRNAVPEAFAQVSFLEGHSLDDLLDRCLRLVEEAEGNREYGVATFPHHLFGTGKAAGETSAGYGDRVAMGLLNLMLEDVPGAGDL